jgi:hypothetical protein
MHEGMFKWKEYKDEKTKYTERKYIVKCWDNSHDVKIRKLYKTVFYEVDDIL